MIATGRAFRAIGGVLAASVLLSGCVSTVAGSAVRDQNAVPVDVPPLDESALDGALLSIGVVNGIMGSTQMKVSGELDDMTDYSEQVSDPDCLATIFGAQEPVYADSGWTAMRDQVAREPEDDNDHWVEQTAVLYPSAEDARGLFDKVKSIWEKCSGSSISVDTESSSSLWEIEDVTAEDSVITQMTKQEDADGWECQHALAVASNLTAETWACGYIIIDEAAAIAVDMVTKAAKK
ncbi:MAG: sensor domain-containing protein [Mycobacterium sp.]